MIDPATLHMREESHLNGGKEWFGYIHRCIEQPRLTRKDVYARKDRSVKSEFRVDGVAVADLDAALVALEVPPQLTDQEAILLRTIGDEPEDRRKEAFADEAASLVWRGLREKALITWREGLVSRTEAGRDAAV